MRLFLTATVLALTCVATLLRPATFGFGQVGRTTLDGVYSDPQAAAGASRFDSMCLACHQTSRFTNNDFRERWSGATAADLFDFLETAEPGVLHGGHDRIHYVELIAYVLSLNDLPASETDLPSDGAALGEIHLEWN